LEVQADIGVRRLKDGRRTRAGLPFQPSSVVFGFSGRRSPAAYLLDSSVKLSWLLRITQPSFLRKLVRGRANTGIADSLGEGRIHV
jgi:hypothetical protein